MFIIIPLSSPPALFGYKIGYKKGAFTWADIVKLDLLEENRRY
jgi:hypothetical protein